jgi:DNA (cytosine-5)-methyltransferase 1
MSDGRRDPKQKGRTFNSFKNALKRQGYHVDHRELRACDYGAPTIRKRFFLVARCDSQPIVWPESTHGDPNSEAVRSGKLLPWHTAAECIDWSIPCPSIFERKRPLAENTMKRIARGIQKFVIDNPKPFIVLVDHTGSEGFRGQDVDDPMQTITSKNGWGVVAPNIGRQFGKSIGHELTDPLGTITAGGGGKSQLVAAFLSKYHGQKTKADTRGQILEDPIRTVDTSNRFSLVTANIMKYYEGGYKGPGASMDDPLPTVTTKDHNALVTSHLLKLRGTCQHGQPVDDPMPTVTAGGLHIGEVRSFLIKYFGTGTGQGCDKPLHTITTKDRLGLVTVQGVDYQIVDIGMRMLEPRELFRGQGLPDSYIIDHDLEGKKFSKATQVAKCGNAVCPQLAEALVRANLPDLCGVAKRAVAQG